MLVGKKINWAKARLAKRWKGQSPCVLVYCVEIAIAVCLCLELYLSNGERHTVNTVKAMQSGRHVSTGASIHSHNSGLTVGSLFVPVLTVTVHGCNIIRWIK